MTREGHNRKRGAEVQGGGGEDIIVKTAEPSKRIENEKDDATRANPVVLIEAQAVYSKMLSKSVFWRQNVTSVSLQVAISSKEELTKV